MKTLHFSALSLLLLGLPLLGCGSPAESQPPAQPPPPAEATPSESAAAPEATPEPGPSEEELKKAAELKQLEAEYAELEKEHAAELQRLTPEIREKVKSLAEKGYASVNMALKGALASEHRRPDNKKRDKDRHPVQTLEFLGLRTSQTVLEYGPGDGWYTELLAPTLAKNGKLFITTSSPTGSRAERSTFYAKRTQLFLEALPEAYGKVETLLLESAEPKLPLEEAKLDVVLAFRVTHGMHNRGTLQAWLAEFHRVLKPKGVLGIEQHRAAPDADVDAASKLGYLPEAFVIAQVEQAGFKLAAKSEVNANPKDTKDHPEGVWALPPTLRLGDTDREKYEAIGESDRMTLKFTKAAK